jgi:hypothetical protein
MAWSGSAIFREWVVGPMMQAAGTGYTGLDSDTINNALFGSGVTPDKDAAVGSTGYNTGTWTTGNEVTDATNWIAKGRALASKTFTTPSSGVAMFDSADTAGGGTVTISGAHGSLILDDTITAGTVADQGVCYLWFGGAQSVTAGTFTVVYHVNGVMRVTT